MNSPQFLGIPIECDVLTGQYATVRSAFQPPSGEPFELAEMVAEVRLLDSSATDTSPVEVRYRL